MAKYFFMSRIFVIFNYHLKIKNMFKEVSDPISDMNIGKVKAKMYGIKGVHEIYVKTFYLLKEIGNINKSMGKLMCLTEDPNTLPEIISLLNKLDAIKKEIYANEKDACKEWCRTRWHLVNKTTNKKIV